MKRLLFIFTTIFLMAFTISCSDNSTGTGTEPDSEPGSEGPTTGTLELITSTSGSDQDSDGYTLTIDGSESHSVDTDETITIADLSEGSHEAELSGIASNCSTSGDNPQNFDITAGETTSVTFEISCESQSGGGSSDLNNKIVFQSDRDGDDEIFVMNADGSNQQKLTDNSVDDRDPVISNDGTRIAFVSFRNNGANIFIMDADGSNIQQLTQSYDMPFSPHLSWSPDDSQIAFHDKRSGNGETNSDETYHNEIYTINVNGSDLTQLTDNDAFDGAPDWSADGIVFNTSRDGGINADQEIYTMSADGSNVQRITDDSNANYRVRWSPDGSKFVFMSDRDGNDEIYTMNKDGSGIQRLTNYDGEDQNPAWSPDGSKVLFVTNRDINREIYEVNTDGSGSPTNLTDNSETDEAPFWSPVE